MAILPFSAFANPIHFTIRLLSKLALLGKIEDFEADFSSNFEHMSIDMVEKVGEKDAQKSNFNRQMEFRKKSIKAVIFDFGKVVIHKSYTPLLLLLEKELSVSRDEANLILANRKEILMAGSTDEIFLQELFISYNKEMPTHFVRDFQNQFAQAIHLNPQVQTIIKELKQQNKRVILFSNTEHYRASIYKELGYYDFFEQTFLSYEMGVKKPNPAAYRYVLEKLSLQPEECLFIDDQLSNVIAAKEQNWNAIQFINAELLVENLSEMGLNIDISHH